MLQPNAGRKEDWGIVRFKDGEHVLVKRHKCGDWQTVRPATEAEKKFFAEQAKAK